MKKKILILIPAILIIFLAIFILIKTPKAKSSILDFVGINSKDITQLDFCCYGKWYDMPSDLYDAWIDILSTPLERKWTFAPFQYYNTGDGGGIMIHTNTEEKYVYLGNYLEVNEFYDYQVPHEIFDFIYTTYKQVRPD